MSRMPSLRKAPVRARDLRANIKEHGYEIGVVTTIEAMLEEYSETRQNLREMAELLNECIDRVNDMVSVGTEMKQRIEEMKRVREQDKE